MQCRYKVIFEPQKTVSAKVEMVVEKSTGGRWRFELRLEATQPDVDGSVTIQAAPGQSALGPVMLYSPTDQPEPFTCHFTHDSSISFDVSPSEVRLSLQQCPCNAHCHAVCVIPACHEVCVMSVYLSASTLRSRLSTCTQNTLIAQAIPVHPSSMYPGKLHFE